MNRAYAFVLGVMIFFLCFALTACAGKETGLRTLRVEVPILVPCKTQAISVPFWAVTGLKKTDSLEAKVRALLAERHQRIGYEMELYAANKSCQ